MLTSKQRAYLRSLANGIEPIYQIGKAGLGDNAADGISDALESREIVKFSVLRSSPLTAKEALGELAERLNAEPVAAIGNTAVLYRRSKSDDVRHIELPR